MTKLTLEQLRDLRNSAKADIIRREPEGKEIHVVVGMGTCGIASGAKDTLDVFLKSLDEHGLADTVVVRQIGCLGLCASEPTVEISVPGMQPVIYGNVNADVAKEIIVKHVIGKQILESRVVARPSADIITEK